MKTRILLRLVMLLSIAFLVTGCYRRYVMERPDMHLAPAIEQAGPEKLTVVAFALNPILDLAEGGDSRFAWRAMMWGKMGEEHQLLALSLNFPTEKGKVLITVIPRPLAEVEGNAVGIVDHGGKRIYNQSGEYREIGSLWRKIEVSKFREFLPEIKSGRSFVREVGRGTKDYQNLTNLFKDFRLQEVKMVKKYIYARYGSNLTDVQLERIAKDDSVLTSFIDWLGRDWKLFLTYPFMGIESSALIMGIAKIFTLPSIWGDKIDRPGYMEYIGDSEHAAKMILRGIQDYGIKAQEHKAGDKTLLPQELRDRIRQLTGKDFPTYEDYNLWVVENHFPKVPK